MGGCASCKLEICKELVSEGEEAKFYWVLNYYTYSLYYGTGGAVLVEQRNIDVFDGN